MSGQEAASIPVGAVIPWAGGWSDEIPDGWLACTGQPCPSSAPDLASLLAVCGSPFGQDGSGAPLLPNLGGQFVRGVQLNAQGSGYDPDFSSRKPGPGVGSHQDQTIVSHQHGYSVFPDSSGGAGSAFWDDNATAGSATAGNVGAEMLPAYVTLIHIVKAATDAGDAAMPAGLIVMYVGDQKRVEDLLGWHECDGQQFSTRQWPDLGKILADGFFPNLLGLFVRGTDTTPPRRDLDQALRFRVQSDGSKVTNVPDAGVLSTQYSALQVHSHGIHVATDEGAGSGYGITAANGWYPTGTQTSFWPDPSSADGKETRPNNIALPFIICQGAEQP